MISQATPTFQFPNVIPAVLDFDVQFGGGGILQLGLLLVTESASFPLDGGGGHRFRGRSRLLVLI